MNKNVLTLDEVAQYTGLSKSWLYKLTCQNKIPFYKPFGKRIFFQIEEIDAWLLQNPVAIRDETKLESQANTHITTHQ